MNCPKCKNELTATHKGEFCLNCGYAKLKRQSRSAAGKVSATAKKSRLSTK